MKAILLTAGYGSRLRPLTDVLPKCLLPINGRPLLEYWFSTLSKAGVNAILMNLHYLPQIMKEWVRFTEYSSSIKMVYEENLLGTGGTLFHNKDFADNEPIMLVHADNLCSADMKAFIHAHKIRPRGAEITMMTFDTPTPKTCGIVEIDNAGIVRAFHEKVDNPPGNLANAAVYIVEPEVMEFLASLKKPVIDFSTEVLPAYPGKIYTFHNTGYHRDIGNPDSYLAAQIEYPRKSAACDRGNGWATWCRNNADVLNITFPAALASAYKAQTIDADQLIHSQSPVGVKGERIQIIHCREGQNHVEELVRLVESGRLTRTNIMIYFKEVSCNFSSRLLFEQTRLRSLAFCASGS